MKPIDTHFVENTQWDSRLVAEAMLLRAQKRGVIPTDITLSEVYASSDDIENHREIARRMINMGLDCEDEGVEDMLWDMFGLVFSASVEQVFAKDIGLPLPSMLDRSPCDEVAKAFPRALRTVAGATYSFARGFTYDLDPKQNGSMMNESFRNALEQCLIVAQRLGEIFGHEFLKKKQKLELNMSLLKACTAEIVDYTQVEALLKQGAEPLGYVEEQDTPDNLYYSVVENLDWAGDKNGDLFKITELFLQYGLDIAKPTIPYDNDDILNPIYNFLGYMRGSMMQTLRLLLDHGLSAEDAWWGWGQELTDFLNCNDSLEDKDVRGELPDYIHKLMLTASYPHVLEKDESLQFNIWLDRNHFDLSRFREWDWYDFELDTSHCDKRYPGVARSIVTLKDKKTGEKVWRFGVKLDPKLVEDQMSESGDE